jgi:uncharacterized protein
MIAVDTNLLIYAHRTDSPFHKQAIASIESLAGSKSSWAIPWPCIHEFFAIVTHPRIYAPPTPAEIALATIDSWLAAPNLVLLGEAESHWGFLHKLLLTRNLKGAQVHDAKIAAICLSHGIDLLWTADRDFSRIPELKCSNPLL